MLYMSFQNTATSQFIPIEKLGLPVRSLRQFRRVNEAFVDTLKEQLLKEPSGSHGCLFVVVKGMESKETFDPAKKDAYDYEVLGGTHLMLATKKLHTEHPENKHYQGRIRPESTVGSQMNRPSTLVQCTKSPHHSAMISRTEKRYISLILFIEMQG